MKVFVEYVGLFVFGFVVFIGGLVALPEVGAPDTSLGKMWELILVFLVIMGGFLWYYNADLPLGARTPSHGRPGSDASSR